MKEGGYTIWGKAQSVEMLAPGAWFVSTAGHGGVKLDAARNRKVPKEARMKGGWYEEDCKYAIAALVHPDVLTHPDVTAEARKERAIATITRWESEEVIAALVAAGFMAAPVPAPA